MRRAIFLLWVVMSAVIGQGATQLGAGFTYQGQLKEAGGPVTGTADFEFSLWDAAGNGKPPTGGAQIGATQAVDSVSVGGGLFTVQLNTGGEFGPAAFNGEARWLQISVRASAGSGTFSTLSPRQAVTAAPYASFAANAGLLNGLDSTAFLQSIPIPLSLGGSIDWSGVILGANNSATGYGMFGYSVSGSGETYGVGGQSDSSSGTGVLGIASANSGDTRGVQGVSSSPVGRGVLGVSSATSGYTVGVQGESSPSNLTGTGVVGKAQATGGWFEANGFGGTGLFGVATDGSATPNAGVEGRSYGAAGSGVRGVAFADQGYTTGVSGTSHSGFGIGVEGIAASTSGYGSGVHGETASAGGRGVSGYASSLFGDARGVTGQSDSVTGTAVWGWAAALSGVTYGVVGTTNSEEGWAVYADGRLGAYGYKAFRIDHPDDPENKYLLHYSAESPEVLNIYSDTVTLDARGEAEVELPAYFAKINTRPRYQLTAVGMPMPNLHVADKIDAAALAAGERATVQAPAPRCVFRIAGGAPSGEVSWEVKAVRNDLWMRNRAASVEVEKREPERGKYQHPELYGQPAEKGMDYHEDREMSPAMPSKTTEN